MEKADHLVSGPDLGAIAEIPPDKPAMRKLVDIVHNAYRQWAKSAPEGQNASFDDFLGTDSPATHPSPKPDTTNDYSALNSDTKRLKEVGIGVLQASNISFTLPQLMRQNGEPSLAESRSNTIRFEIDDPYGAMAIANNKVPNLFGRDSNLNLTSYGYLELEAFGPRMAGAYVGVGTEDKRFSVTAGPDMDLLTKQIGGGLLVNWDVGNDFSTRLRANYMPKSQELLQDATFKAAVDLIKGFNIPGPVDVELIVSPQLTERNIKAGINLKL